MPSRARRFLGLLLCLSFLACTPSLANRVPDRKIVMSRMVIMPAFTTSDELDFTDNLESDHEDATALFNAINPEVRRLAMQKGAKMFPSDWQVKCGEPCLRLYFRLVRWGSASPLQIAAQMTGFSNYGAHSIAEWKLPGDYTPLRNAIGADFALFVRVQDVRQTTGRTVGDALTGRSTTLFKEAVACVADLVRQEMIWCHPGREPWDDLHNPQDANRVVRELLSDLTP